MRSWREYLGAAGAVAATTVVCLALRARLQTTDVAMLLLLAVVFSATRWRRGPVLVATALAVALFDFLFVPPYYTFTVSELAYVLTFLVMFAVALVMGRLTTRIREQADEAAQGERRAEAELALSRELAELPANADPIGVIARHLGDVLGGPAVAIVPDGDGALRYPPDPIFESVAVRVALEWARVHGRAAGAGTANCAEAEACVVPVKSEGRIVALIVVDRSGHPSAPGFETWRTADALAAAAALALDRAAVARTGERARMEIEAERLRTALLSSLSHDLRTPLATIEGAASSLRDEAAAHSAETRRELAESIVEESHRMSRLVGNLLDMVRVETGNLAVHKTWQPLEEPLGVALIRLDEQLRGHPVATRLPSDLPLVPVDELLLEQVFLNLLENAVKYTPVGTPITVSAWPEGNAVVVEVADAGPGIPAGEEEAAFRKFYRGSSAGAPDPGGAGLGLAICRGIITAHGGRIWVERSAAGGAAFRFTLPLEGPPVGAALTDEAGE